jgi:uncharacterized FlaG/YvyC family protein
MSEEEISATGQFPALSSADFATSYQTSNTAPRQAASATSAAQNVNQSGVATASAAATATTAATAAAATATTAAVNPAKQPTDEEIHTAVAAANANLSSSDRTLNYRVDAVTGISIATIRNSHTGVVVQQIPGADVLALARMLADWSPGKHMMLDLIA